MARDIEEFLRRAAERRRNAQQGGGQQRQPARPQPKSPPPRQPISDRDVVQPRKKAAPLPSKEPVKATLIHETVNQSVQRHLDVSDIVTHVDQLGDVIEQADERMEAHLDKTFDHDIGSRGSKKKETLNDVAAANAKDSTELADNIFKLLQNPKTIRQSILITEILNRPTFLDEE